MKTIYKYPLQGGGAQVINMPCDADILTVDVVKLNQHGPEEIFIWALVDKSLGNEEKRVRVFGTGHDIPDEFTKDHYIGTFQIMNGTYIFHVFNDVV